MTITENFECFRHFNFERNFLKKANPFQKIRAQFFSCKYYDWRRNISIQNCSVRSQVESNVEYKMHLPQRMEFLPVTTFFFQKFCFSLRTSYKELVWSTNCLNDHIYTFQKRWSFIWGAFSLWGSLNFYFNLGNVKL